MRKTAITLDAGISSMTAITSKKRNIKGSNAEKRAGAFLFLLIDVKILRIKNMYGEQMTEYRAALRRNSVSRYVCHYSYSINKTAFRFFVPAQVSLLQSTSQ